MKTRMLGNTDLEVSTIGFGAWAIGGGNWEYGWGHQDDDDSIKAIHEALDTGINWIDTAAVYGLGRSEEVVAKALKGIRREVIIATKFGIIWNEQRDLSRHLKAASIRREVEESLKRLRTDYIDLYQMHWPDPDEDIEEGWSVMEELVTAGKVRNVGVSNFTVSQLERINAIYPVASLQPPYNMFNRKIERDILPYCSQHHLGVVSYSPLQNGLLTGKFTKELLDTLPDDDFRKDKNPQFQPPRFELNLKTVAALQLVAQHVGRTIAQLAIAWVLRSPEVTSAIV
ncbi:aldo/keto reductase, partial [Candidatus Neomarinimicrobiota bacterium]